MSYKQLISRELRRCKKNIMKNSPFQRKNSLSINKKVYPSQTYSNIIKKSLKEWRLSSLNYFHSVSNKFWIHQQLDQMNYSFHQMRYRNKYGNFITSLILR